MSKYATPIKLHVINFTDIQLYIYDACPHDELTIIMRRYMMRIAERIAIKDGLPWLNYGREHWSSSITDYAELNGNK